MRPKLNFIRQLAVSVFVCLSTALVTRAQNLSEPVPPEVHNTVQTKSQSQSRSKLYEQAYLEIADMLDGKKPLSIKRAVFLAE